MRFRPRWSIRTLAIVVTLVCAYFRAWEATKRYGPIGEKLSRDVIEESTVIGCNSPVPFVIQATKIRMIPITNTSVTYDVRDYYYLWLFGPTIELPFESRWK